MCIEDSKFKSANSYISGFTLGLIYEHESAWMVNETDSGYTIEAEATLEYGHPNVGTFWTRKVTLRTYNFNPCTDTGILFVYKE